MIHFLLAPIREWITKNQDAHPYQVLRVTEAPLLKALAGSAFFQTAAWRRNGLVEFQTLSPRKVLKTRRMYQVDALTTRSLELLGARVALQGEEVFHIGLRLAGHRTTLGRILWGVPSAPLLMEDRDMDYHDFVPATFDVHWGIDRNDVLLHAQEYGYDGLDVLLRDLFNISDSWHKRVLQTTRPRRKTWRPLT